MFINILFFSKLRELKLKRFKRLKALKKFFSIPKVAFCYLYTDFKIIMKERYV